MFHDGVEDDARYALAVARTARARGATIADPGCGRTARCRERRPDRRAHGSATSSAAPTSTIRARAVVDATGVWAGLPDGALPVAERPDGLLPSRGRPPRRPRDRIPAASG